MVNLPSGVTSILMGYLPSILIIEVVLFYNINII